MEAYSFFVMLLVLLLCFTTEPMVRRSVYFSQTFVENTNLQISSFLNLEEE